MAATRLSRLQKRRLRWVDAEDKRTNGGLAKSPQERVLCLAHDKGNSSRSLRALEKRSWIAMGRAPGGKAEKVILTPAGRNGGAKLISVVNKD